MTEIGISVVGARQVALRFETFPKTAHDRLLAKIADLTAELDAAVLAAEPERTGKLRRETAATVGDYPERILGRVRISAEFGKAAALEYGAHATTNVSAHQARLDHVFAVKISPIMVEVGAHSRRLNIAERRYLRGPLEAMAPRILAELQASIDQAAAEG